DFIQKFLFIKDLSEAIRNIIEGCKLASGKFKTFGAFLYHPFQFLGILPQLLLHFFSQSYIANNSVMLYNFAILKNRPAAYFKMSQFTRTSNHSEFNCWKWLFAGFNSDAERSPDPFAIIGIN